MKGSGITPLQGHPPSSVIGGMVPSNASAMNGLPPSPMVPSPQMQYPQYQQHPNMLGQANQKASSSIPGGVMPPPSAPGKDVSKSRRLIAKFIDRHRCASLDSNLNYYIYY